MTFCRISYSLSSASDGRLSRFRPAGLFRDRFGRGDRLFLGLRLFCRGPVLDERALHGRGFVLVQSGLQTLPLPGHLFLLVNDLFALVPTFVDGLGDLPALGHY